MIMLSIVPVLEKDMDAATRELLQGDLRDRRSATISYAVFNRDRTDQPLIDISRQRAYDVLRGYDPEGVARLSNRPDEIAAWQISFTASSHLNLLYALGSERISTRVKAAHELASLETMRSLAGCVLGGDAARGLLGYLLELRKTQAPCFSRNAADPFDRHLSCGPDKAMRCRYVMFQSEVSHDQCPALKCVAFMINRSPLANGSVRIHANSEEIDHIRLQLYETHETHVYYYTTKAIGSFQLDTNARELRISGIPQEVARQFFSETDIDSRSRSETGGIALTKQELFKEWRARAERLGWGPSEAAVLLREAARRQFWEEVKSRAIYEVTDLWKEFRRLRTSLRSFIKEEVMPLRRSQERPQEKDNHHTQSQSH